MPILELRRDCRKYLLIYPVSGLMSVIALQK